MKKTVLLIIPLLFLFVACEDEPEPKDCAGVEGGIAQADSCGVCVGGTTDAVACTQDCADVWGGNNICGCMDMAAINYDVTATFDNNSCEYYTTPPPPSCTDGIDNDGDGNTDLEDSDCQDTNGDGSYDEAIGEFYLPFCNDGIDNDEDGLIDLDDPDCKLSEGGMGEFPPPPG